MKFEIAIVIVIICLGALAAFVLRKLTFPGALMGAALALLVYTATGIAGILMMTTFFVLAVLATGFKHKRKEALGAAEVNKGRRDALQVFANAGVAGLIAAYMIAANNQHWLLHLAIACCFASATADTLSSELGTLYGSRFLDILSFRRGRRGDNGVISMEGSLIGIVASTVIGLIYYAYSGNGYGMLVVVIAGTAGNLCDSFLGATLERKNVIGNNMVNFLNTLVAAVIGYLLTLTTSAHY